MTGALYPVTAQNKVGFWSKVPDKTTQMRTHAYMQALLNLLSFLEVFLLLYKSVCLSVVGVELHAGIAFICMQMLVYTIKCGDAEPFHLCS